MTTEIVILGAGYSGLLMALRLARTTQGMDTRVSLIEAAPVFGDRIRQHELSVRAHPTRRIDTLACDAGVRFIQGRAAALDLSHRLVHFEAGSGLAALPYDRLVYALGSFTDPDAVPGLREHAHTFSRTGAESLRDKLPALAARGGRLLVCGGGLSGIEAAAEFAEAYPALKVILATGGQLAPGASDKARQFLRAAFARRKIELVESARITQIESGQAQTTAGAIGFDLCLWAGAFAVPALAREAGLRVNERGQALVDGNFHSLSHPDVMVVGDAAAVTHDAGAPLRMACATSTAMGAHAADALCADLRGHAHPPFRMAYLARNISLGRRDGVIDWVTPDDRPRNRIMTGRLAALYKNLIGALVWRFISNERRRSGIYIAARPLPTARNAGSLSQHSATSK